MQTSFHPVPAMMNVLAAWFAALKDAIHRLHSVTPKPVPLAEQMIVVVACALSRIQVVAQVRTRRAVKATPIAARVLPATVTLVRHRYAPVLGAMRGHAPSTVVADDASLSKAFVRGFLRQAGALSLPVRTVSVALFRLVVVLGVHAFASKRVGSARKTASVVARANPYSLLAGERNGFDTNPIAAGI